MSPRLTEMMSPQGNGMITPIRAGLAGWATCDIELAVSSSAPARRQCVEKRWSAFVWQTNNGSVGARKQRRWQPCCRAGCGCQGLYRVLPGAEAGGARRPPGWVTGHVNASFDLGARPTVLVFLTPLNTRLAFEYARKLHDSCAEWLKSAQASLKQIKRQPSLTAVLSTLMTFLTGAQSAAARDAEARAGNVGDKPKRGRGQEAQTSSLRSLICNLNWKPSKVINMWPNSCQVISLPSMTRSGTRPSASSSQSMRPRTV
jgi:hypothetical protein